MAVIKSRRPLLSLTLRECRRVLGVTQKRFAEDLGVALETYRTWDSGRRNVPSQIITRANILAARHDRHSLVPLDTVAILIGVHVRTLHAAAKDGRLRVTYDTRTTFRRLRTRATLADADVFVHSYFDKAVWPPTRPAPLDWRQIPADYDDRLRTARHNLGLSQAQFATRVGAACKAVVYQWESRKRCPSPMFWQRILDASDPRTRGDASSSAVSRPSST